MIKYAVLQKQRTRKRDAFVRMILTRQMKTVDAEEAKQNGTGKTNEDCWDFESVINIRESEHNFPQDVTLV